MQNIFRVWACIAIILLFTGTALAQRDLGTITGTVTDATGAVVPGAKITITENATGLSYTQEASAGGDYSRPALKPGTYTVNAEAVGFRRASQENVLVSPGERTGVPLVLEVGNLTESVIVSAQAPLLQTESTTLGGHLEATAIADLPLGSLRYFPYLARLSPGVLPAEPGARDSGTGGFSANGVRSNGQNNFLLNGVDNNVNVIDFMNGASYVTGPPPEAIGEMTVLTSGYNAEYGRAAGGVINVNLKTGTNQLHGGLWEIMQNTDLNSNSWANNRVAKPRTPYHQNQFGAAAGGPIIKNRFFIFGDYQGTRIANIASAGLSTIPTPAMTKGDFSSDLGKVIATDANGSSIASGEIFDPNSLVTAANGTLSRTPFPGNIIPSSRFDPAAAKILAAMPATNEPILAGFPQNDFYGTGLGGQHQDSGDLRSDLKISDKDSLYGSLSWSDYGSIAVPKLPEVLDGSGFTGETNTNLTRGAQLGYTRVWSPSIISETRVGFSRLIAMREQALPDTDEYKAFGIGGYDPTNVIPNDGGLPYFGFSRYSVFGSGQWLPTTEYSTEWDFIQNVSIMRGSHSLKFGGEFRPIQFPFMQYPEAKGLINFSQNGSAYPSTVASSTGAAINSLTGDDIASFLLGNVDNGSLSSANEVSSMKKSWAFYAQDDWKVTPKFTVNLGIRYELFSPVYEKFGRQSNFDWQNVTLYIPVGNNSNAALPPNFATAFPNVTVSRGQVSKYMFPWDKTDFGPRIGLAYNVFSKTVIRAGFGMFYGGEENEGASPNLGESAPFNESVNLGRFDTSLNSINTFAKNPWFPGGLAAGFPLNTFSLPAPTAFLGFGLDYRTPLVQKWSLAVQRELPWHVSLETAYVGNHQLHQNIQGTANACPNYGTTNSSITCASLRPIPYISNGTFTDSFGYGNYDALTVKAEKRLDHGLQFTSSYTWGHALANSETALSGGTSVYDPTNYASGYANAAWDIRQAWVTGFNYELPFGRGKALGSSWSRPLNQVLGGWMTNGILTMRTGTHATLGYNGCQGVWNSCRPDIVAGQNPAAAPSGGRGPNLWFNTSAVTTAAPLTGGNAGAYNMTNPGASVLDLSLFKAFHFTETKDLEFRAEAFNMPNKTQLSGPDYSRQDATFGVITSSSGARTVQFSLRAHF
jgi:hypothetical protein